MADFIWMQKNEEMIISRFEKLYGDNILYPVDKLLVCGMDGTYSHILKGDDFITVLGCCYYPNESIQDSISKILESFNEATISDLKKQLVGQFIVIIKKKSSIYIFGDSGEVRNIFYSKDFHLISSSFSVIEDILGTSFHDIDHSKVIEYIAMRHILYPVWLGNTTIHVNIRRLRSFEYIVIDTSSLKSRIGEVYFTLDNTKEYDLDNISSNLIANLRTIVENSSFKDRPIGITLTGGYDTRLIAAVALKYYNKALFRLATLQETPGSILDSKIAKKISKTINIELEILSSTMSEDFSEKFYFFSEGLSPLENSVITPIIERTGSYSMGLGGCFGTELFMRLKQYSRIEDYIEEAILKAKTNIQANDSDWIQLRLSMLKEFDNIRKHYILSVPNPTDDVRIFQMLCTAFFSSFMLSAYNINGLQLEPYGHLSILEIALKIPDKKNLIKYRISRCENFVQKMAMSKICYRIGKIITTHYQPMLPCSILNFPYYLIDYLQYKLNIILNKMKRMNSHRKKVIINDLCYLSNGWDIMFLRRLRDKYNVNLDIVESYSI